MQDVTFITGNNEKFLIAHAACKAVGFDLKHGTFEIDEIQGEEAEPIAIDKAKKAYEAVGGPIVVNDDSWSLPGLNGFPGPYMKSMLHWLTPDDFLNLTRDLQDRRAIITQLIVYMDEHSVKVFRNDFVLTLLTEARGNYGNAIQKVITSPNDNGLSVAEAYDTGTAAREREVSAGWDQFAEWYIQKAADRS